MNKEDVRKKFESVISNSQYVRVSDTHPLELYIGKNEQGYPTLRYNGYFKPVKIVGNSMLEIKQVKTSTYYSLLFCFNSFENQSLFYNFCADIIAQTELYDGKDGYAEIVNRYTQWKKMFYSSSKTLNENEILGLIGELLFLRDFAIPKYGITKGLIGWSGPEPTHKDFSFDNLWYEIKTINSNKNSINISSIEQLDSDRDGNLIVYSLEKMSPSFQGIKLNALVNELLSIMTLDADRDLFLTKLKQVGYAYSEVYDNYVFNYICKDRYVVSGDFPRIKSENLPVGIGKVQYEIFISQIVKYKEDM